MKPHGSIRVVIRWRDLHVDPIRRCFDDPEWLNNGYLASGCDPRVRELANSMRLGTEVTSQDMCGP
jgi:hypothetical protein